MLERAGTSEASELEHSWRYAHLTPLDLARVLGLARARRATQRGADGVPAPGWQDLRRLAGRRPGRSRWSATSSAASWARGLRRSKGYETGTSALGSSGSPSPASDGHVRGAESEDGIPAELWARQSVTFSAPIRARLPTADRQSTRPQLAALGLSRTFECDHERSIRGEVRFTSRDDALDAPSSPPGPLVAPWRKQVCADVNCLRRSSVFASLVLRYRQSAQVRGFATHRSIPCSAMSAASRHLAQPYRVIVVDRQSFSATSTLDMQ